MFFSSVWDPKYIIYQIVAVQSLYYSQLGVTLLLLNQFAGHMFSIEQVFNYRMTNTSSSYGWVVILSLIVNSFAGAASLLFIVERSKKCLDHAATVTIIHLIICSFYAGFPSTWSWWLVNIISCIIMAVVGEYICMRRELRDIPITTKGFGASPLSPPPQTVTSSYSPSSSPFTSKWDKSTDSFDFNNNNNSGKFGEIIGSSSGMPLSDPVAVQPSSPLLGGDRDIEFTQRFGSGEFTPRFGSGLGFSSVYPSPSPSSSSDSVSINIQEHAGVSNR